MSIFRGKDPDAKWGSCKRCGRAILLDMPGKEYGSVCGRKLAGQVQLDSQALVSGKVLHKKETVQEHRICRVCGCTDFSPCPGGCAWVQPDLCSSCATDEELRKKIDKQISAEESAVAAYRGAVLV